MGMHVMNVCDGSFPDIHERLLSARSGHSSKPLVGLNCLSCIRAVSNRQQHLKTARSGALKGGLHQGNRPNMALWRSSLDVARTAA